MTELLHGLLDRAAETRPQAPAVRDSTGCVTWGDLREASVALAARLETLGVVRGDRVCGALPSTIATAALVFATSRLGAVVSVLHPEIRPFQLHQTLADARPRVVVTSTRPAEPDVAAPGTTVISLEELVRGARSAGGAPTPRTVISMDLAALHYTSGSSGSPKGVMAPHRNMCFAADAIQKRLRLRPEDVITSFIPFSFDYGLYQLFLAASVTALLDLVPSSHAGPGLCQALRERGTTVLPANPRLLSIAHTLASRGGDVPGVRMITNTGEALTPEALARLPLAFPNAAPYLMYGLTECKRVSILTPEEIATHGNTVGRPLDGTEVWAADDSGIPLPAGEVGELYVRGPNVMAGYWGAPELTEHRYPRLAPSGERVLRTGDRGSVDQGGFITFLGRLDDVFKSGGVRVSTLEIEEAALGCAGVGEAAVVLTPDTRIPVLFVATQLDEAALVAALLVRLEPFRMPARIEQVATLPRNGNGKVDRVALVARLAGEGR